MSLRISILDLAPIAPGQNAADSFAGSVALAQIADPIARALSISTTRERRRAATIEAAEAVRTRIAKLEQALAALAPISKAT